MVVERLNEHRGGAEGPSLFLSGLVHLAFPSLPAGSIPGVGWVGCLHAYTR